MQRNTIWNTVLPTCWISILSLVLMAGCDHHGSSPPSNPPTPPVVDPHAGHSHGPEVTGPHGGHLVELGDEQYHAEWTHDDASGEVIIYLLDSTAKTDVAIPAGTISIATKVGETEKQYELAAVAQADGQSSKFALSDHSLMEALKAVGPGVEATVMVKIEDAPFVGKFEHHAHAGH